MKKIVLLFLGGLLLTSCAGVKNVSTETASINPSTVSDPIKVDIDVDGNNKVTGYSKSTYILNFLRVGDSNFADGKWKGRGGATKSAAHYNALKASGADVLVNPQYEITTKPGFLWLWTTVEAKVTGFKGNYEIKE